MVAHRSDEVKSDSAATDGCDRRLPDGAGLFGPVRPAMENTATAVPFSRAVQRPLPDMLG